MKQKMIEKIPFLTVPKVIKDKKAKYIGVTALHDIANEQHIILEVYRNEKKCLLIPVIRYVATKKDWGVYDPESKTWSKRKISTNDWHEGMCWMNPGEGCRTYGEREDQNRLYSSEDLKRIKEYFPKASWRGDREWWDYFESNECEIKRERENKVYQRRRERLEERKKNTPELPEKELMEWADNNIFFNRHYLYYKKKGRHATVACSKCGGVAERAWKTGDSFIGQFESIIEEPINKHIGHCPLCGVFGIYMPQGRMSSEYELSDHVFMASRYKEKGIVVRYIQLNKGYQLEFMSGDNGEEMAGAYEILSGIEIARKYIEPGKPTQTDFHKHDPYVGKDFWDDCNLYGMNNIQVKPAVLYTGFETFLHGTEFQYSQISQYAKNAEGRKVNAFEYLSRFRETPQIEMLVKLRLYKIVEQLVKCYYGIVANDRANRPDEFLGIYKDRLKLLMKANGNTDLLKVLQIEKRSGTHLTEEQLSKLAEIKVDYSVFDVASKYISIQKVLNYIEKYAGCEFGTGCSNATARLINTATTYFDYLSMRTQLGYDLNNTVYQRPRNLQLAHNKLVMEQNKEEEDKRIREVNEKYPKIKSNYRKLRNKYFYEDDNYIIRPARSAAEIVEEGRILHHCVGGNNYLEKHNEGRTTILMLRFKESAETPYITVEIKNNSIEQWYGAHDKKPDKENMQKWLDAYTTRLMCTQQNDKDVAIRIHVAAVG